MLLRCLILASLFTITACTWVSLSEPGKLVSVATSDAIASCKKIGNISAKTRHFLISGSEREKRKVATELETLARNEAVNLKANTIVAEAEPINGQQRFIAYQCP